MISHSAFLLGYPDSNQEKQDQNLLCYHYTISQFLIAKQEKLLFPVCECKGTNFFCILQEKRGKFFEKSHVSAVLREKLKKNANFGSFGGECQEY